MLTHSIGGHLPVEKTDDILVPTLPKGNAPGPKNSIEDASENEDKSRDPLFEEDEPDEDDEEIDPGRPDDAYSFYKNHQSSSVDEEPDDDQEEEEDEFDNEREYRFGAGNYLQSEERYPFHNEKHQREIRQKENLPCNMPSSSIHNVVMERSLESFSPSDMSIKSLNNAREIDPFANISKDTGSLHIPVDRHICESLRQECQSRENYVYEDEDSMQEDGVRDLRIGSHLIPTPATSQSDPNVPHQTSVSFISNDNNLILENNRSVADKVDYCSQEIKPWHTGNMQYKSYPYKEKSLLEPSIECNSNPLSRFTKISSLGIPLSEQSPVSASYTSTPHASPLSSCYATQDTGPPTTPSNTSLQLLTESSSSLMKLSVSSPTSSFTPPYNSHHFRSPSQQNDLKRGIDQVSCDTRPMPVYVTNSCPSSHIILQHTSHSVSHSYPINSTSMLASNQPQGNILDMSQGPATPSNYISDNGFLSTSSPGTSTSHLIPNNINVPPLRTNFEYHPMVQSMQAQEGDPCHYNRQTPQHSKENVTERPKKKGFMIEDIMSR